MRAHIIGIAGPSSSGKTALAYQAAQRLPGTLVAVAGAESLRGIRVASIGPITRDFTIAGLVEAVREIL